MLRLKLRFGARDIGRDVPVCANFNFCSAVRENKPSCDLFCRVPNGPSRGWGRFCGTVRLSSEEPRIFDRVAGAKAITGEQVGTISTAAEALPDTVARRLFR
jgi:hypothetical protein